MLRPFRRLHRLAQDEPGEALVQTAELEQEELTIMPKSWSKKPQPTALPAQLFKPKAQLAQSFLADPNYLYKLVHSVDDDSPGGRRVLELGCGTGSLTSRLFPRYPDMFGIELDQRAMRVLQEQVPGVTVIRSDVLMVNYTKVAELRGGPLTILGNLPFHVTTQVLFCLLDHAAGVRKVRVTMQKEVARRICAKPRTKDFGIPSVAFQLYTQPKILFDIPPTAFFPRPNVMCSYVEFDFEAGAERRAGLNVNPRDLRNLTQTAFNQRRKMLRNSLKQLLECHTTLIDELPPEYDYLRAQSLEPWEFVHLTQLMFGKKEFPKDRLYRAWRGEFGRRVRDKENYF